jgi:hypothetical protein
MRVSYVGANLLVKVLLALVRQAIGGDRWRVVYRASRVTEVGGIGQRFRPKEHPVLILG